MGESRRIPRDIHAGLGSIDVNWLTDVTTFRQTLFWQTEKRGHTVNRAIFVNPLFKWQISEGVSQKMEERTSMSAIAS